MEVRTPVESPVNSQTAGRSPVKQLQSSPLFAKNDIKSLARIQRIRGTMHRNEFSVALRAGTKNPHRRDRGNI